jgi:hypothetical protein
MTDDKAHYPPQQTLRRSLAAWAISFTVHALVLLLTAYLLHVAPRGAGRSTDDRMVGVALVSETAGERQYAASGTAQAVAAVNSAGSGALSASQLAAALPAAADLQVDLSGVLPGADAADTAGGDLALPSAAGQAGSGARRMLGDEVSTSVFGTSGSGTKFIYVFDRSGSMGSFGGRPLAAAKRELIASLQDLHETNQFQIIFYNDDPHVFRVDAGSPRMAWGTEESKQAAARFVQGITANGSTRHLDPLRMALGLQPDVVFFLTDADEPRLTDQELRQVRRWNKASAVNAIEFGFGPQTRADNFLMRLARENGGQHVYVDVSQLGRPTR